MAAKAKYVHLLVDKTGGIILPEHALSGYVIVSDYIGDQGRHLFLHRGVVESPKAADAAPKPPAKKRVRRTKAQLAAASAAQASTQAAQ